MIGDLTGRREATESPSAPSWTWLDGVTHASGGCRLSSPWQRRDDGRARIEVRDPERSDVHGPDAIHDLIEPDVVAGEGTAEEQHALMPRHTAVRSDSSDFEVAQIVEAWEARRQPARRGPVVHGGGGVIERLVRPVLVVFAPEPAKAALLGRRGPRRRPRGFRFEHGVKLLVRPVLFRMARQNAFRTNPQLQPPDGEMRQPPRPVLAKGVPLSLRIPSGRPYSANARLNRRRVSRRSGRSTRRCATRSDSPRRATSRDSTTGVTGAELAFVIDRPEIVGLDRDTQPRFARDTGTARPACADQARLLQQGAGRRARGPYRGGIAPPSQAINLGAPHVGCRRRPSTSACVTLAGVAWGQPCGRRDRSANASTPPFACRLTHLYRSWVQSDTPRPARSS